MRVFVAGASGALGRRLVPELVRRGHAVTAATRTPAKREQLAALGAAPVVVDALDEAATLAAVTAHAPEVVVHQLTAIPAAIDLRRMDRDFAQTNRLRTEGTEILLRAAQAAGARRIVAQGFAAWTYARTGGWVKDERDATDRHPPREVAATAAAVEHLERAVLGAPGLEGVVLRYGYFYGPGTAMAEGGPYVELLRRRRFPIVGDGAGTWSFIHVDDAARATALAVERGAPGVYNVADDEPARVADWLPVLAQAVGAPRPWRVPAWLGRLAAGQAGLAMMTELRGAANAKAKRELGWQPGYATWRDGFRRGLRAVDT